MKICLYALPLHEFDQQFLPVNQDLLKAWARGLNSIQKKSKRE